MIAPIVETPGTGEAGQAQRENSERSAILTAFDDERKAFAKAAALAATAGCTLHELAGGGYLLGRWTMCRELPDLRAVHALLRQMGVRA